MKKIFLFPLLTLAFIIAMTACNNGEYDAYPDSDLQGVINPLNPPVSINKSFDWTGGDPMSCNVNGVYWQADHSTFNDFFGYYSITGQNDSSVTSIITLYLPNWVSAGNTYNISYGNEINGVAYYIANVADSTSLYSSSIGLGEVKILENDQAHIKGQFYFIGARLGGSYMNLSEGYFNVNK